MTDPTTPHAPLDLDELERVAARSECTDANQWAYSDVVTYLTPARLSSLVAELRRLRAAGEWKPLLSGEILRVDEGRAYLFAVDLSDGGWEYFSDSIGWDADEESVPAWRDGGHGWSIEDVTHFAPLPPPPVVRT